MWAERSNTHSIHIDSLLDDDGIVVHHNVENISISVTSAINPIDIGSWCYSKRKKITRKRVLKTYVKSDSFIPERKHFLNKVVEYIYYKKRIGISENTIHSFLIYMHLLVEHCDKKNPKSLNKINNIEILDDLVCSFISQLRSKIRSSGKNKISSVSAVNIQFHIIGFFEYIFESRIFPRKCKLIKHHIGDRNNREPPANPKQLIKIYYQIFHQITDQLLGYEKYPLKINVESRSYWAAPLVKSIKPIDTATNRYNDCLAFDRKTGKILSLEESISLSNYKNKYKKKDSARRSRNELINKMNAVNSDKYHPIRLRLANTAIRSFVFMFTINTGINLQELIDLKWDENQHDITATGMHFFGVKARAEYKDVDFYIGVRFLKNFRKFQKLRSYVLSAKKIERYPKLFFTYSPDFDKVVDITQGISSTFNKNLETTFGVSPTATLSQWRVFRSTSTIKTRDPEVASILLGNSIETINQHYSQATEMDTANELEGLYESIRNKINTANRGLDTPIGKCLDFNNPEKSNAGIEPSCSNMSGCIGCENFTVHNSLEDYRKILSLKYLIYEQQSTCDSDSHFNDVFSTHISLINGWIFALQQTLELTDMEIKRIHTDVFEHGNITQFWEKILILGDYIYE